MTIADMTGKTVVITGDNSGIGKQTALALCEAGAKVVITARDPDKGEAALSTLGAPGPAQRSHSLRATPSESYSPTEISQVGPHSVRFRLC